MRALPRLEVGPAVTGVGSLPFEDVEEAVDFVRRLAPRVPFCPQLPRLGSQEGLIAGLLGGCESALEMDLRPSSWTVAPRSGLGGLREAWRVPPRPSRIATALESSLLRAVQGGAFSRARALKLQVVGPLTLASSIHYRGRPLASRESWLRAASSRVEREALRLAQRFGEVNLPLILVLDEPVLAVGSRGPLGAAAQRILAPLIRRLSSRFARVGLHVCASQPLAPWARLGATWLSFDAVSDPHACAPRGLKAFLARGGILAPGLVPTRPDLGERSGPSAAELAACWPGRLVPPTHRIVTSSCGLGLLDEGVAEASLRTAARIQRLWSAPSSRPSRTSAPFHASPIEAGAPWVEKALVRLGATPSNRTTGRPVVWGGGRPEAPKRWISSEPRNWDGLELELLRLGHWADRAASAAELVASLRRARRARPDRRFRGAWREVMSL